jgi:UDP-sugar transporter A1/2/3
MGDLSWRAQREDATYLLGLLAIGCATMTSGFAGVYNEKIIKNGQQPLLLIRSFQLSNNIYKYYIYTLIIQNNMLLFLNF